MNRTIRSSNTLLPAVQSFIMQLLRCCFMPDHVLPQSVVPVVIHIQTPVCEDAERDDLPLVLWH